MSANGTKEMLQPGLIYLHAISLVAHLRVGVRRALVHPDEDRDLALNMFCQYMYMWMYVIPAADLHRYRPSHLLDRPVVVRHGPAPSAGVLSFC